MVTGKAQKVTRHLEAEANTNKLCCCNILHTFWTVSISSFVVTNTQLKAEHVIQLWSVSEALVLTHTPGTPCLAAWMSGTLGTLTDRVSLTKYTTHNPYVLYNTQSLPTGRWLLHYWYCLFPPTFTRHGSSAGDRDWTEQAEQSKIHQNYKCSVWFQRLPSAEAQQKALQPPGTAPQSCGTGISQHDGSYRVRSTRQPSSKAFSWHMWTVYTLSHSQHDRTWDMENWSCRSAKV